VTPRKLGGMHGYLPENPEMRSSFFLVGPGVQDFKVQKLVERIEARLASGPRKTSHTRRQVSGPLKPVDLRVFALVRTACGRRFAPLSVGHYNVPMKPSIFLVEDDPDISHLVRYHLEADGFTVRAFATGNTVITDSERNRPKLFILDIMVPGKDGLELCRQIRHIPMLAATPVIFLTAKNSESDRILGLELGADDYISKPFSPRELVARVKAVLRRFDAPLLAQAPLKIGDIQIDPGAMTLTVRGDPVTTTATEFRLLDHFMHHAGRVLTREQLLDSVWRDTAYVTSRSVDVYVRRIREKIELDPNDPRHLLTVRGAGYRFEPLK
jgi:DNA-binding response OmpR family regulator